MDKIEKLWAQYGHLQFQREQIVLSINRTLSNIQLLEIKEKASVDVNNKIQDENDKIPDEEK